VLFDVVQGEGSSAKIADGIRKANGCGKVGAGTADCRPRRRSGDLWAFNEGGGAGDICSMPVISAVGHEVDFTIADFVADVRASTPTQAGVLAVPDAKEVISGLDSIQKRLAGSVKGELRNLTQQLQTILASAIFRQPRRVLDNSIQRLDETVSDLNNALQGRLDKAAGLIGRAEMAILRIERCIYRRANAAGQLKADCGGYQ
jgi:exodeoxyribonuclease VII large subunit